MKHLSGAPFYGRLLALPTRITLGWKINVVEKHSSVFRKFVNYGCKMFYNIEPRMRGKVTKPTSVIVLVLGLIFKDT